MPTETRDERLARRIADLHATDPEFAAATPDDAISVAIDQPGVRLPEIIGHRARRVRRAARTGTTRRATSSPIRRPAAPSADLLPRFETITYAELSARVQRDERPDRCRAR